MRYESAILSAARDAVNKNVMKEKPERREDARGQAAVAKERGIFIAPFEALVALAPLMAYHGWVAERHPSVPGAANWIRGWFMNIGVFGAWTPALGAVALLLIAQVLSAASWRIRGRRIAWMFLEGLLFALPILFLSREMLATPFAAPLKGLREASWNVEVAVLVGAGIYEELLFRGALLTCLVAIGGLVLGGGGRLMVAVAASGVAFAACHHLPGGAPFALGAFLFRCAAGVYLGTIFWFRGYGPAAMSHLFYNLIVSSLS